MKFSVESTPSIKGKTALVTGGNSGLGFETVRALASKGAHVLLAARSEEKGTEAVAELLKENPSASIEYINLDLGSLKKIRTTAEIFQSKYSQLDILVNNAGLMAMPEMKTEDGFESQFGVNHLGHWALTSLLLPSLQKAPAARIVTVTSTAHHFARRINFKNPHLIGKYSAWGAYCQSKLANYYFALGLHKEFEKAGSPMSSFLSHPGLSHTELQVNTVSKGGAGRSGQFFMGQAAKNGMSAKEGAMPQIRAAMDPNAKSGQFYAPRSVNKGEPVIRGFHRPGSTKVIAKLWELSEKETGLSISI